MRSSLYNVSPNSALLITWSVSIMLLVTFMTSTPWTIHSLENSWIETNQVWNTISYQFIPWIHWDFPWRWTLIGSPCAHFLNLQLSINDYIFRNFSTYKFDKWLETLFCYTQYINSFQIDMSDKHIVSWFHKLFPSCTFLAPTWLLPIFFNLMLKRFSLGAVENISHFFLNTIFVSWYYFYGSIIDLFNWSVITY